MGCYDTVDRPRERSIAVERASVSSARWFGTVALPLTSMDVDASIGRAEAAERLGPGEAEVGRIATTAAML